MPPVPDASHRDRPFLLVTGGTRSGKSRFAVERAKRFGPRIVFFATCRPIDRELHQRILRHRRARPSSWRTIEPPHDPAHTIARLTRQRAKIDGLIMDCLTTYVSDCVMRDDTDTVIQRKVHRLCRVLRRATFPVILVTNEVGSSVVPEHPLGRRFRDAAGLANQAAAAMADGVVLMVAGMPVWIKGGGFDGPTTVA